MIEKIIIVLIAIIIVITLLLLGYMFGRMIGYADGYYDGIEEMYVALKNDLRASDDEIGWFNRVRDNLHFEESEDVNYD